MNKTALITGITGQDGAYLAEYLLKKGYIVHGIKRRSSLFNTQRIDHLYQDPHLDNRKFILHYGDLTDSMNLTRIIQETQPDEIYNLAAMSHVHVSFETPEYTANADGIGTLRILEAVRLLGLIEKTKIYQASTSELFGKVYEIPQSEKTPFYPRSPYGAAKAYAYYITVNYREAYNMFACNGILFNHESPIRGETFVTRKITRAVARIAMKMQDVLYLGNLSAKRDWGHAKDYIEAMYLILQHDKPEDFIIATGITNTVRDFCKIAFSEVGIDIEFKGEGVNEIGIVKKCHNPEYQLDIDKVVIMIDEIYLHDFNCGLKAYNRDVVKNIELYGEMHRYIPILAKQAGFTNIGEKVISHQKRLYGKTKFGISRFINGFLDLLSISFITRFGKKPMHFFGLIGTIIIVFGFLSALYLGIEKVYFLSKGINARLVTDNPFFYISLTMMIIGIQLFLIGYRLYE